MVWTSNITMSGETYRELHNTQILPALRAYFDDHRGPGERASDWIVIQEDGAPGHGYTPQKNATSEHDALVKDGAKYKVRFVKQPANSPETNICDLGMFNSIQTEVRKSAKLLAGIDPSDKHEWEKTYWKMIREAYEALDPEKIEGCFRQRGRFLDDVVVAEGGRVELGGI